MQADKDIVTNCIELAARYEFYPARRGSCCVCGLSGTVQRLIKRVAELERKQAGVEGKLGKLEKQSPPRGDS